MPGNAVPDRRSLLLALILTGLILAGCEPDLVQKRERLLQLFPREISWIRPLADGSYMLLVFREDNRGGSRSFLNHLFEGGSFEGPLLFDYEVVAYNPMTGDGTLRIFTLPPDLISMDPNPTAPDTLTWSFSLSGNRTLTLQGEMPFFDDIEHRYFERDSEAYYAFRDTLDAQRYEDPARWELQYRLMRFAWRAQRWQEPLLTDSTRAWSSFAGLTWEDIYAPGRASTEQKTPTLLETEAWIAEIRTFDPLVIEAQRQTGPWRGEAWVTGPRASDKSVRLWKEETPPMPAPQQRTRDPW